MSKSTQRSKSTNEILFIVHADGTKYSTILIYFCLVVLLGVLPDYQLLLGVVK